MAWRQPPPEVIRRVEGELGQGFYEQLAQAWVRVQAVDPSLLREQTAPGLPGLISWYRTSAHQAYLRRRGLPAAETSLHELGLAIDVHPQASLYEAVARAATQQRFTVMRHNYPGMHIQAITPEAWRRSPLRTGLRRQVVFSER